MKRVFVMLLMLGSLVATVGFANQFSVNNQDPGQQDISSGEAFVGSCNGNVGVDLAGNGYNANVGDFVLNSVLVNADPTCAGDKVTVQLTTGSTGGDPDGDALGTAVSGTLDGQGDATLNFIDQNIEVADITDVHVMIDAGDNTAP